MSLTIKIGSLLVRTLAKPIANGIKRGARNHEPFRRKCVAFAQALHRLDVRWRVGLLQDPAVIDLKTEAETKADEQALKKEREEITEKHKPKPPRVRPLAETKAIDMGANFISEAFMFLVAGGIIVWEQWRSRRKASDRRDEVDEKLDELEEKNSQLLEEIRMLKARVAPEEFAKEMALKSTKPEEQASNATAAPAAPAEPPKGTAPAKTDKNTLNTHDLAIPLPRAGSTTTDAPRTLRVLLLSPTSTTTTALPATLTRIQHFAALNGSLDSIIIFLLDAPTTSNPPADHPTPLHAYTHLSATLFTDSSIADLPLLPLSSLASLAALLKTYITANSAARATQNFRARRGDAFNTALDLLPWCTANAARAPLGEDEINVLTDLFGSVASAPWITEISVIGVLFSSSYRLVEGTWVMINIL
ncbi:putative opa3 domain-containing protein [Neofusicoccum parvum UCRNP2]|uniref:Putative opa3 domain-containing protein n=1 Tax=Botryosphaeria parva (strain UCR-NP2) TaxID=1287680 RepID=R1GJP9_BOTPV|nr:putative opa3 domain-containing protein [Neofusicoccum parvum UCRNP2]